MEEHIKGSKVIRLNGEEVTLYPIAYLGIRLGRSASTIRRWEIGGIIPKTPFKDTLGRRMYTKEQIDAIVKAAEEAVIKPGLSLCNTRFPGLAKKYMTEINNKYLNK